MSDHAKYIKTIFCDIDGCIFEHTGDVTSFASGPPRILPGVLEKFKEWSRNGYRIILTTGRQESLRETTHKHLNDAGIVFSDLIMDLPRGTRIIINDFKPDGNNIPTASGICLKRNGGMENVDI